MNPGMFVLGAILCLLAFVIMIVVMIGTFTALPEGRNQTATAKYVATFTYGLRKGGIWKVIYWAAPIVFIVWLTLWGGVFYLAAAFVGWHANKKYRLRTPAEIKIESQPVGQVGQPEL